MPGGFIFESKSEFQGAAARLAASVLVVAGCLFGLSTVGIAAGWRLAYAFTALGLVCSVEIGWRRKQPIERIRKVSIAPPWEMSEDEKRGRWERDQQEERAAAEELYDEELQDQRRRGRSDLIKSVVEPLFATCLAILTALLSQSRTPPKGPSENGKTSVLENDQTLSGCQTDLEKANADLQRCKATVDLDARNFELVKKIWDNLQQHPPKPPNDQQSSSRFNMSFGEILIGFLILMAVVMIARKHKEAVPVAGAAALALEALKHAAELAKMKEYMYDHVLWAFLIVAGALTVLFLIAAVLELKARELAHSADSAKPDDFSAPKRSFSKAGIWLFGKPDNKPEGKENYISSLGFSIVVLLWAAVMVGYKAQNIEQPGKNGHSLSKNLTQVPLTPLGPFLKGKTELRNSSRLASWKEYVASQSVSSGDVLVLVGSADCTPFRQGGEGHDNATLALERAKTASNWLKSEMVARDVRLEVSRLGQYKSCRESEELRAVYPFLIHDAQR